MSFSEEIVARRYAKAFMLTVQEGIPEEFLEKSAHLHKFLNEHTEFAAFLNVSLISLEIKRKLLDQLCSYYTLADFFKSLLDLLQEDKRLFLFSRILLQCRMFYKELRGIIEWKLTSYPILSNEEKKVIVDYLEKKTEKKAIVTYYVDKTLIAGIRAESDYFLWEHSARRLLQSLSYSLLER